MENTRPYWKVIVSLTFSLAATVLYVVVGWELVKLFMPFVIGWVIAFIANPLVCWLEKRLKIVKKLGSVITIILVLGTVVGLFYLLISNLAKEMMDLAQNLPKLYEQMKEGFTQIGVKFQGVFQHFPKEIQDGWSDTFSNLASQAGEWVGHLSEPTVTVAGNVAKSIPSILIGAIVTIVSAYLFVSEREEVIAWAKKVAPTPVRERMELVVSYLKSAVGGYFKAQFQIMLVLWAILFVGFLMMGVDYAVLLALLFAFLDFLPFLGTAITLIPWAVYKLLVGNYKMAIGLVILYAITQVVRQVIQPKLVGDNIGLKPLPTLALLYLGYKMGSVLGAVFAVPVGMILINMYRAGAFDYILDDVKILLKGIRSLRD